MFHSPILPTELGLYAVTSEGKFSLKRLDMFLIIHIKEKGILIFV